jgi:hypothetical protein
MINITLEQLMPIIKRLGPLRIKLIGNRIFHIVDKNNCNVPVLRPGEVLIYTLASLLASRRPVAEDAQDIIIDIFSKEIIEHANKLEKKQDKSVPVMHLTFLDSRYVRLTSSENLLDLTTGNFISKLKTVPVEITSFDLTALYFRTLRLINSSNIPTKSL